jgi:hypothetical protein
VADRPFARREIRNGRYRAKRNQNGNSTFHVVGLTGAILSKSLRPNPQ